MKEAQTLNDGQNGQKDGADIQQLEGFIVSVMRNFFLDLSVDQIEVLCTNFANNFVKENMLEKQLENKEEKVEPQTDQIELSEKVIPN